MPAFLAHPALPTSLRSLPATRLFAPTTKTTTNPLRPLSPSLRPAPGRRCTIIVVSATTADEVKPLDDLSSSETPSLSESSSSSIDSTTPPIASPPSPSPSPVPASAPASSPAPDSASASSPTSASAQAPAPAPAPAQAPAQAPAPAPTQAQAQAPSRYPAAAPPSLTPPRRRPDGPPFVADPSATYYTRCGACSAVYEMDPSDLGRGRKVACAVCGNQWFQRPDRLLTLNSPKEQFIEYPLDKKDLLIENAAKNRRPRPRTPQYQQGSSSNYGPPGDRDRRRPRRDDSNQSSYSPSNSRPPPRQRSPFSVFLGNLSYEVVEDDIKALLDPQYQSNRVSIVRDHTTGRSKGFAFCDVSSQEEVDKLIAKLDGTDLNGRTITAKAGRRN